MGLQFCLLAALTVLCLVGCRRGPADSSSRATPPAAETTQQGETKQSQASLSSEERSWREEQSKQEAVALYPELGVAGTAVNREYVRRYKLYRSVNPAFFAEPDWPKRLANMLAIDLGVDPRQ